MCIFRELALTRTSASPYIASKGLGEKVTRDTFPDAIVMRPSVVFGPEDDFFNRFGALACYFPVLPLLGGGGTRLQPVYVGDVGQAVAAALSGLAKPGAAYELGGPRTMTLREAARANPARQLIAAVCSSACRSVHRVGSQPRPSSHRRRHSGFFPKLLTTTRDQVDLLASDNVVSAEAEAEGRVLSSLGILPQAAEAIIPSYLARFRRTGQYEVQRSD